MAARGHVGVSLILAPDVWALIDRLVLTWGHANRRGFLNLYLQVAEQHLDPAALVLPPRRRKGAPTRQDKIMLPRERLPFLNRIKAELGLSRSDAIHALLLTLPVPPAIGCDRLRESVGSD